HHGLGIGTRIDAHIVALDRANKGFGHSVALRTFDWRGSRLEPDVAGEAAGVTSQVAAAVVGEPFDRDREAIDPAEAVFDSRHHQVTHIRAGDASRGGEEADGLPITAVECEGDPHPLPVVAANLEAIGAPASIAFTHRDAAIMAPLDSAGMAIEQHA